MEPTLDVHPAAPRRAEAERRSHAFDHLAAPAVVLDAAGAIVAANDAWTLFARMNGGAPEKTGVGVSYLDVCDAAADQSASAAAVAQGLRGVLAGGVLRFEYEYACHSPWEDRWFLLQAAPIDDLGGAVVFHVDITSRKALERALAREVERDPLTGLANRRAAHAFVAKALAEAGPEEPPVAVLFADLDRFKPVNDTLGHASGDELLCKVASRLRRLVAPEPRARACRLGGDEFAIVASGLDEPEVWSLVERLRTSLALPFQVADHEVSVGVSVGLAFGGPGTSVGDLFAEADEAMYEEKREREKREHGAER